MDGVKAFSVILFALCLFQLSITSGNSEGRKTSVKIFQFFNRKSPARLSRSLRSTNPRSNDGNTKPYLKLVEELHDIRMNSGQKAVFKCKVQGYPKNNITFTWYKNNEKIDRTDPQKRVTIRERRQESRLVINDAYSTDSATYRCEASNVERRVSSSAELLVSFILPPDDTDTKPDVTHLKGSCVVHAFQSPCREYVDNKYFYKEAFQNLEEMTSGVQNLLNAVDNLNGISHDCQHYSKKAFCYYLFPPCKLNDAGRPLDDARAVPLCREDCDLLEHNVCKDEFQHLSTSQLSLIAEQANCSQLPRTTAASRDCTSVGLPRVVAREHNCYNGSGESYRGTISITMEGNTCQAWPARMLMENPELSGGHNFCRNPQGTGSRPWCFVDEGWARKEECQVPECKVAVPSDLIMIIIPAVSVPLLLGCFLLVFCFACRRKRGSKAEHTKGIQLNTNKHLSAKAVKVPKLEANLIHLDGELGDGKFGKVFKARIHSNLYYCPTEPVAVKKLHERASATDVEDFQVELEHFSTLQHANVACMKAVVVKDSLRCMIFEYTSGGDLHDYLVIHNPQADFAQPQSSVSSHTSSFIEHGDFVRMAIQISAGMEYLSSNNFVHRDLAARNILVCGNMELKVCNLGVIRDSHLSSYYRSPQGGQMLPIRWMSPESIQNWKFSDKSTVWSFGVVLWEMFSYGLQPYCGFGNHEVLEMISRRQLLPCPDQCPAKMYSLMQECWCDVPQQRPQFKDIHAKLVGWEGISTTRMTSQLAQGIHRQLTNAAKEQPAGGYGQFPPQQGRIQNDSRLTVLTRIPDHAGMHHSPIPSGAHNVPNYPSIGDPAMYNRTNYQPPPPHNGMGFSQVMTSYSGAPSRSSGSVASSDHNHHHHALRRSNLTSHQEVQEPRDTYPPPPPPALNNYYPPQSGRTSRPNLEKSTFDGEGVMPAMYVNLEANRHSASDACDPPPNQRLSRPSSRMRPDGGMPMAVYQEQGYTNEGESHLSNGAKPALAPKPPTYYNATQNDPSSETDNQNRRVPDPDPNKDRKATSCDSGLPCDDMDSEGADSHRPLLSGTSGKLSTRPLLPQQFLNASNSTTSGHSQSTS